MARESIYKTLTTKGDKTDKKSLVLSLSLSILSEKKLAKISGNKKVQMIPQKDLQKTTGYVHGANNPVGIHKKNTIFPFISISLPRKQVFLLSQLERLGVLSASTVKNLLISLMPSLLILVVDYILYATVKLNGIWKDASKVPRETLPFLKNLLSKSVSLAITSVILISTWSYQVTYHALKKQLNSS